MKVEDVEQLPWREDPESSWQKVEAFSFSDAPLDERKAVLRKAAIVSSRIQDQDRAGKFTRASDNVITLVQARR